MTHRWLERVGVTFSVTALLSLYFRMGCVVVQAPSAALALGAGLLVGAWLADVLTGIVHWVGDTLGSSKTPILGPVVQSFREHHVDPTGIVRHDFFMTNGDSHLGLSPFLAALLVLAPTHSGLGFFLGSAATSTCAFIALANQFHKWAHTEPDRVPRIVRTLQGIGLVLSPEHHSEHHKGTHTTHYCVTNGWANPLLQRVQFFRALERVVSWVRPGAVTRS